MYKWVDIRRHVYTLFFFFWQSTRSQYDGSFCACVTYLHSIWQFANTQYASWSQLTSCALRRKSVLVAQDRRVRLIGAAQAAESAIERNDPHEAYRIVRSLAGLVPRPLRGVKDEDGKLITDACATRERWVQHFAGVFQAVF